MDESQHKIQFSGTVISVQPRSNVWRYRLDNRTHSLTGYNLFLRGVSGGVESDFTVAISGRQQESLRFHIGDAGDLQIYGIGSWRELNVRCLCGKLLLQGLMQEEQADAESAG